MHPELFKIPGINYPVSGYGVSIVVAFLVGTWWMTRRAAKVKADADICLSLALIAMVFGWMGGRVFYVIHYWKSQFAHQPSAIFDFKAGGFEVYGGLITAAVVSILYMMIKRVSVRLYADLTAPTLLFGMGVGRIGCYLAGCCWGATCPASLPWAVTFPPYSSATEQHWQDRRLALPAELILVDPVGIGCPAEKLFHPLEAKVKKGTSLESALKKARAEGEKQLAAAASSGDALKLSQARGVLMSVQMILDHLERFEVSPEQLKSLAQSPATDAAAHPRNGLQRGLEFNESHGRFRSVPVHPAQVYSAIGPLLLAILLNACFYRRKRHGTVMLLAIVLYAIERFIEEMVRMDNPRDTFGLTVSQGISIGFLVFAGLWYMVLQRLPLRSPRPATWVTKETPPETAPSPS